jgi:anaerobic magnesium-protoporphyrin IX monomethyl ester cyclase
MNIGLLSTDADRWGLGVRLLSAILKKAGHSTRLVFLDSEEASYPSSVLEETRRILRGCELIGVSCLSRGASRAVCVLEALRSLKKLVVWGGLHATLNPEFCAKSADIICRGEGEGFLIELIRRLETGDKWEDIENAGYLKDGEFLVNPVRPPFENLDDLPVFDYDRSDEYHLIAGRVVRISPSFNITSEGQIYFIGSRGCAFHCTYCCNRKLKELYRGKGQYIRRMSISNYVAQLETIYRKHFPNGRDFFFLDEDFFARNVTELREFSKIYPERVGIPFECCASPPFVTEEKMALLAEAGLWRIRIGVETGSERTKEEIYDRPISNRAVENAARIVSKYPQIVPCYFFIIANPYETRNDIIDTFNLMKRLDGPYYAQMFNLVFFPGSTLYDRAIQDGIITGMQDSGYDLHFRRGLRYENHKWKKRNLYLNSLLFMAEGKVTDIRLGLLPRWLLPLLISPKIIQYCDQHQIISRTVIALKYHALSWRAGLGGILKARIKNPGGIYNLALYIKKKLKKVLHLGVGVRGRS